MKDEMNAAMLWVNQQAVIADDCRFAVSMLPTCLVVSAAPFSAPVPRVQEPVSGGLPRYQSEPLPDVRRRPRRNDDLQAAFDAG